MPLAYTTRDFALEVLRSLINRLRDHHFYPKAEYGPKTVILSYVMPAPLDVADEMQPEDLEKAADAILLQIREGSYETPVDLPMPQAIDLASMATDPQTGLCVRFTRFFVPDTGTFMTRFDVGMQA